MAVNCPPSMKLPHVTSLFGAQSASIKQHFRLLFLLPLFLLSFFFLPSFQIVILLLLFPKSLPLFVFFIPCLPLLAFFDLFWSVTACWVHCTGPVWAVLMSARDPAQALQDCAFSLTPCYPFSILIGLLKITQVMSLACPNLMVSILRVLEWHPVQPWGGGSGPLYAPLLALPFSVSWNPNCCPAQLQTPPCRPGGVLVCPKHILLNSRALSLMPLPGMFLLPDLDGQAPSHPLIPNSHLTIYTLLPWPSPVLFTTWTSDFFS